MRWRGRTSLATAVVVAVVVTGGLGAPPATARTAGNDVAVRPVGVVTRTFVDRDRRTPADPSAGVLGAPRRVLPTTIYYPARGRAAAGTVTRDARPAGGPFPLVLFNPGAPGEPTDYEVLLADWAAHGYVVAGIEFPVSSVAGPDAVATKDLPTQTADARFVLDRVLDLDPAKVGIPELDADRIAVAGHSFGGATALSLVSKCCRDDRLDAAVALAPVAAPERGPALRKPAGPILFVHARQDRAVPWADTAALCRTAGDPRRFLTVEGLRGTRAHVIPFVGEDDPYSAVVRPAIVDFLDGYLRDRRAARVRLARAGAGTDVATIARCPAVGTTAPTSPTTPPAP